MAAETTGISVATFVWSVLGAGALGGAVNAFTADEGFALPQKTAVDGRTIVRLGALGNVFVGALSGCVSTILANSFASNMQVTQLLLACANSLLVGVSGARWLTSNSDRRLLKAAAEEAMTKGPVQDQKTLDDVKGANGAKTLEIVRKS